MSDGRYILLFDGDRSFCASMSSLVHPADFARRNIAVDAESTEAQGTLAGVDQSERRSSLHVVSPDGKRFRGGVAVLRLTEAIPPLSGLSRLLASCESGWALMERVYSSLVSIRNRLS